MAGLLALALGLGLPLGPVVLQEPGLGPERKARMGLDLDGLLGLLRDDERSMERERGYG